MTFNRFAGLGTLHALRTLVFRSRTAWLRRFQGRERDVRDESASVCLGGAGRQCIEAVLPLATDEVRGRLVVMLDGRPLVTQPSPSPDFVLTPRTAPSADRRPHAASPDPRRLLRQAPAQPATPRAAPRTPPPPRHPWRQAFKRETRLSHPIKGRPFH